jgi:hypothetical protein
MAQHVEVKSVSRRVVVLCGLVVVVAFALLGRTAAQSHPSGTSAPAGPVAATSGAPSGAAGGGGGGLPVGAPQSGPSGHGHALATGGLHQKFTFSAVSCVHSPNSPTGVLARGSTSLSAGIPDTLSVSTDSTTDARIALQLSAGAAWSDQHVAKPPTIRRNGMTITFSGVVIPETGGHSRTATVSGSLTCTTIITLG